MGRPRQFSETEFLKTKIITLAGLTDEEKCFLLDVLAKRKRHEEYCPQGHRRTVKNTSWYQGYPRCRVCQHIKYSKKAQAKRNAAMAAEESINA